jgi:hypothetical protein
MVMDNDTHGAGGKSCKGVTLVCGTKRNHPGTRCVDVKLFTVGFDIGFCAEVYFIAAHY